MALINCSSCGKQISDKAKVCPQCGMPVILPAEEDPEQKVVFCGECGAEIPGGMTACPNCGCPVSSEEETVQEAPQKVEVTAVNLPKMRANTKKYIIIGVAALVLVVLALFIGSRAAEKKRIADHEEYLAEYSENLEDAAYTMLLGGSEAEKAGNLIKRVWYNSIYEERDSETDKFTRPNGYFVDDFNDALSNLFADRDFQSSISSIKSYQSTVAKAMKNLKNPPEEFEDAYDALRELYDAFTAMTNLVVSPSGSLNTFSEDFKNVDAEVLNCYQALQMYIDD